MRVWFMSMVAVAGVLLLAGCDAVTDTASTTSSSAKVSSATASSVPSAGRSKTAICAKALGVVVLSEIGDDAQRRVQHAKDTAEVLDTLASETRDSSLSSALRGAASKAAEVTTKEWGQGRLKSWATQEQARFDALRKVCV
jgi:hypothetical protein